MNIKLSEKLAKKVLSRASSYANHRRLNGVHISNYVHHIGGEILVTSKKYFYIGFGSGFLLALLSFVVILMLKNYM